MEAYCQISAGGMADPNTTFAVFIEGCMREPGAYILTVANHCTGACVGARMIVRTCMCVCACVRACLGGWVHVRACGWVG